MEGEDEMSNASDGSLEDTEKSNTNLSLLQINAQSLTNIIDHLQIESEKFDILTVCETWLNKN